VTDTRPVPAAVTAVRPRLPAPARTRWQPLRIGLVNLYRFDDETFTFEDGRLLLRGNNGTGKSRVLALTVPFLFDGQMEPHRIEPDGDTAKRMEWNLLLGKHDDRLGYAWLELGRREDPSEGDSNGEVVGERYLTIGCGMRATAGKGAPRRWFFVTDQRVGEELSLIAEAGHALTRDRLIEAIGDRGQVLDTATDYRRVLDRKLFRLGEHRYEALVDLLVQLRRPQLSRQLDESLLSEALSEALPPLSPAVIADVADAFRALDDDRDQLEGYQAALDATERFLATYRGYGQVAARRRATAVTQANSRYERLRGELRDAERRRDEADAEVARLETHRDELAAAERAAGVEVRTLEASEEMEAVRELDAARSRAAELADAARARADDLARAEEDADRWTREHEQAQRRAVTSRGGLTAAADTAGTSAAAASLAEAHRRATAPIGLPDARDGDAVATARRQLEESIARSSRAAEHVMAMDRQVRDTLGELTTARSRLDERSSQLDRARDAVVAAEAARADARAGLTAALRRWAGALEVLTDVGADAVEDAVAGWDGEGTGPVTAAADRALTDVRERSTRQLADLDAQVRVISDERVTLSAERDQVAAGVALPPPAPHTRDPDARSGRAGAPLWRLVDLAEVTGTAEAADTVDAVGYEAALEAAGLLDAWVTPDGALVDADDAVLVASDTPPRADGGLTSVLVPAVAPDDAAAAAVPTGHVVELLSRIGAHDDGEVWVAPDGRWRLGPLHGRWSKDELAHLAHAARERARRRRLAELEAQLDELDERDRALTLERRHVEQWLATAQQEHDSAPGEDALRGAHYGSVRARDEVAHHPERVAAAEVEVAEVQTRLESAQTARAQAAADLGVPDRAEDAQGLLADLATYRATLTELWAAVTVHATTLWQLDGTTLERDRAAAERDRRREQAKAAEGAAADAATRRDALQEAVGRTAEEIIVRVEQARARQLQLAEQGEQVARQREQQMNARTRAATEAEQLTGTLAEQDQARAAAVEHFRRLVRAGFFVVAGVEVDVDAPDGDGPWAPDPAVCTTRRVNDDLADVGADDADWERVQRGLHGHYTTLEQALLPHALQPTGTFDDDLFVVTTSFQGRTASMPELGDQLADEVIHRQSLLDAREREVLENHLVGEVATQLHELIRAGESMVAAMNAELAARPTSTGMRLRFSWKPRPDGPEALADARRRLLAADHVWSGQDREALGAFLQARIREVRDTDDTATWQEQLTQALDYRRWHLFAVEREQEGTWVRLTRRTHGTGSGGEKALALTVPQFAAVAAHYRSADEHAPRLIALDEAFVGIDGDMRAKCMDLLVRFDLDVAMTSEREWACYPTVPAIAIHQLSTRPGIDAIGVHRWVWNGHDRLEVVDADGQAAAR
jgi:uncharacterized protein (TIGR02680 family)